MNEEQIKAARTALSEMDDCARMDTGVDAVGPRGVLESFISLAEASLMPTPTSAAEGVQSIDTPEFRKLLGHVSSWYMSSECKDAQAVRDELIAHIDTKMAEQRQAALRESSDKQAAIFSEENASLKARVRKLEAKHATDVETAAKALYYLLPGNTQGSPANYPWQDGGNSHMQMLARNLASAALASRSLPAEAAGSDIEWAIRHVRAADKELGSVLIGSAPDPQGRGPAFLFAQLRDATEWLIKQIAAQPVPSKEVSSEKCDCSICYICPRHAVARLLGKSEAPSAEPVGDSGKASVAIGYVVQHDAKGGNFFTDTSSFEHMRGVYGDAAKLVSAIPAANEQATKDGS